MAFLTLFRIATGNIHHMIGHFVIRRILSHSPCGAVRSISHLMHTLDVQMLCTMYNVHCIGRWQLEWDHEGHPERGVRLQWRVSQVRTNLQQIGWCWSSKFLIGWRCLNHSDRPILILADSDNLILIGTCYPLQELLRQPIFCSALLRCLCSDGAICK